MRLCYQCGTELPERQRVPFKELCPHCDAFLHCCRNCRLNSPDAHNHCLSRTTEYVADVERGNYCDEFDFRQTAAPESSAQTDRRPERSSRTRTLTPRERFNQHFKD